MLARNFAAHGVTPRRVRSAGSVDAVKRSVLGAAPADVPAIGVVSAHAVAEELRAGVLEEVCPTEPLPAS